MVVNGVGIQSDVLPFNTLRSGLAVGLQAQGLHIDDLPRAEAEVLTRADQAAGVVNLACVGVQGQVAHAEQLATAVVPTGGIDSHVGVAERDTVLVVDCCGREGEPVGVDVAVLVDNLARLHDGSCAALQSEGTGVEQGVAVVEALAVGVDVQRLACADQALCVIQCATADGQLLASRQTATSVVDGVVVACGCECQRLCGLDFAQAVVNAILAARDVDLTIDRGDAPRRVVQLGALNVQILLRGDQPGGVGQSCAGGDCQGFLAGDFGVVVLNALGLDVQSACAEDGTACRGVVGVVLQCALHINAQCWA